MWLLYLVSMMVKRVICDLNYKRFEYLTWIARGVICQSQLQLFNFTLKIFHILFCVSYRRRSCHICMPLPFTMVHQLPFFAFWPSDWGSQFSSLFITNAEFSIFCDSISRFLLLSLFLIIVITSSRFWSSFSP